MKTVQTKLKKSEITQKARYFDLETVKKCMLIYPSNEWLADLIKLMTLSLMEGRQTIIIYWPDGAFQIFARTIIHPHALLAAIDINKLSALPIKSVPPSSLITAYQRVYSDPDRVPHAFINSGRYFH